MPPFTPGTNYYTPLDANVMIAFTNGGQYAMAGICNGNPNVVALHPNTYMTGCQMVRSDVLSGINTYSMTGTTASPAWSLNGSGGTVPSFADAEVPTPATDGVTTVFTLAHAPNPVESLQLELNGQGQIQGVDYTLLGTTITMASAPLAGTYLQAWYRY